MRALVTGGRGGIGAAICQLLEDPLVLDLPEFDVADVTHGWESLEGEFEAAFLNAGVATGHADIGTISPGEYGRAVATNLDGVVYGTRELASRLMPNGGSIVVTASLAGLTAVPEDPVYALSKHGVIGFVRSVAPQLAVKEIRINALCPGFTDTPLVREELRDRLDVPLMEPSFVAEAALRLLDDPETGRAWVVQPNRVEPFRFPGIPGPR